MSAVTGLPFTVIETVGMSFLLEMRADGPYLTPAGICRGVCDEIVPFFTRDLNFRPGKSEPRGRVRSREPGDGAVLATRRAARFTTPRRRSFRRIDRPFSLPRHSRGAAPIGRACRRSAHRRDRTAGYRRRPSPP